MQFKLLYKEKGISEFLPILIIIPFVIYILKFGLQNTLFLGVFTFVMFLLSRRFGLVFLFTMFFFILSLPEIIGQFTKNINVAFKLEIITLIYTIIGMLLGIYLINYLLREKDINVLFSNSTNVWILFYIIIILFSIWNSPFKTATKTTLMSFGQFLAIYFIIIMLIKEQKIIEYLIKLRVFLFFLYLFLFMEAWRQAEINEATFLFAASVSGAFPVLIAFKILEKKKLMNIVYDILLLLVMVMIFYSGLRRAFLSLLVTLIVFMALEKNRFLSKIWLGLVVAMFILLSINIDKTPLYSKLNNSLPAIIETRGKKGMSGRYEIWQTGLILYHDYPLFGVGFGESRYKTISYGRLINLDLSYNARMHNTYLKVLVETGPAGLLVYLIICFLMLKNMLAARKIFKNIGNRRMALFSTAYFAGFIGTYISAFFGWSGPNKQTFWIGVAMSVAFLEIAKRQEKLQQQLAVGNLQVG